MSHKFKIRYTLKFEDGAFETKDLQNDDQGLTDSMIVISMVYPDDGSYSQEMISSNGVGAAVTADEQWKAWLLWGVKLAQNNDLSTGKRAVAGSVAQFLNSAK